MNILLTILATITISSTVLANPEISTNKNITVLPQGGGIRTKKVIKHTEYFSTSIRVNCKRLTCEHRNDIQCQSQLQEQQPSHTHTISLLPGENVKIDTDIYVCSREFFNN